MLIFLCHICDDVFSIPRVCDVTEIEKRNKFILVKASLQGIAEIF